MNIRCDREVAKEMPKAELEELPLSPDIIHLKGKVRIRAQEITRDYRFITGASKGIQATYRKLQKDLKNTEKVYREEMNKSYREACRERIHNKGMEKQRSGVATEEKKEPTVHHQLEERAQVARILCDFRNDLSIQELTDRKVCAIDILVSLASRCEVRRPALNTRETNDRDSPAGNIPGALPVAALAACQFLP
ncbi:hypothetical protein IF1G_09426 [Cordyceps javanica]|uniref:Uncharacterized protein n=1 Tax=Cordyceps javanica TaxID=43265 RepID=A0A545VPY3_9HYPO|nr:hypothetical protein IF1G_09426 [Cordyceps javanica]TQW03789.1 hypothetical protein IF2G_08618 [Cordyceps javanica]